MSFQQSRRRRLSGKHFEAQIRETPFPRSMDLTAADQAQQNVCRLPGTLQALPPVVVRVAIAGIHSVRSVIVKKRQKPPQHEMTRVLADYLAYTLQYLKAPTLQPETLVKPKAPTEPWNLPIMLARIVRLFDHHMASSVQSRPRAPVSD
jgi:hypothetical protein